MTEKDVDFLVEIFNQKAELYAMFEKESCDGTWMSSRARRECFVYAADTILTYYEVDGNITQFWRQRELDERN